MSNVKDSSVDRGSDDVEDDTLWIYQVQPAPNYTEIEEKTSEKSTIKISYMDTYKWSRAVPRLDKIGAKYWFDESAKTVTITKPSSLQTIPVVIHRDLLGEALRKCTGALKYSGKLYAELAQTVVDKEAHRMHVLKADLLLRMKGKPVIAFECAVTRHRKEAIKKANIWLKNPKMMAVIVFSVDEAYPYTDPTTPVRSKYANLETLQEFIKVASTRKEYPVALNGHVFCSNIHCRFEIIQRPEDIPSCIPPPQDIRNNLTCIQREEGVSASLLLMALDASYNYHKLDAKRFNHFLNEAIRKAAALQNMPEANFDYFIDWDYHKECLEKARPQHAYYRYRASPWFKPDKKGIRKNETTPNRSSKKPRLSEDKNEKPAGKN